MCKLLHIIRRRRTFPLDRSRGVACNAHTRRTGCVIPVTRRQRNGMLLGDRRLVIAPPAPRYRISRVSTRLVAILSSPSQANKKMRHCMIVAVFCVAAVASDLAVLNVFLEEEDCPPMVPVITVRFPTFQAIWEWICLPSQLHRGLCRSDLCNDEDVFI